jgi:RND family efflux transporter MFP subunit
MSDRQRISAVATAGNDDGRVWVDRDAWQQLARSVDGDDFHRAWLQLQCLQISDVRAGLVLAETTADLTFAPAAVWPESDGVSEPLLDVARASLEEGEALVVDFQLEYASRYRVRPDSIGLSFPLRIQDRVMCVAAIEVGDKHGRDIEAVMRQLQWGVSWLEAYFLRSQGFQDESTIDRLVTALFMTATASRGQSCKQAVTSFVTELATRLDCERVSCGLLSGRNVKVISMSHTGQFGRQMNLVNAIAKAMDEALEQDRAINYPEPSGNGVITHNHEKLAGQQNGGAILTVPLHRAGKHLGAICLERSSDKPFDSETVKLCESISAIVGPIFEEKRLNDRWITTKLVDSTTVQLGRLFGPRHLGRKLVLLTLVALGVAHHYVPGQFSITAQSVIEGAEQRVLVTPYDGYVASSMKRVGDSVRQGDVIATMDDTDLRLDLVELTSGRAQAQSQYDEAIANHERVKAKVFDAKIAQADARIALVNERLNRTRLVSPLDGIIVRGDLSQSLGAAVTRGEVLFEIASLYDYRVNLQVDERDISYIEPGQSVRLLLSSMPDSPISITVDTITPLTRAAEGRNVFRVEATLEDPQGLLRPGMEGVAKISIDERSYAWIWTRELRNWMRLTLWRWFE